MTATMIKTHFRKVMAPPLALARTLEQLFDVRPDAVRDRAASAGGGMRDVPLDALLSRRLGRHAMGPVPLLVQGHGRALPYIALTTFSVTFLASPSSIMVLSR